MNKKMKQIGYLTALVIITGGTIGSGIFLKNESILANAHNDLMYTIIAWIVSIVGVIAIGFALIELSSSSNNDQGILTWIKNFSNSKMYKFSSSYMLLVYYPLTLVCLPIYVVASMDDVFISVTSRTLFTNDLLPTLIAVGIVSWLLFFSWWSLKLGERIQWFLTVIKFIPIILLPIFAYIYASNGGDVILPPNIPNGLNGLHPGLGIIASIPAILFAFDGFFTITTLRSNLKKQRQMPWIILVGLILISSTYLYLSIAFALPPNNGSSTGISGIPYWVSIMLNTMIVSAILGIVNGYCLSSNRIYEIAAEEKSFYCLAWIYKKFPKLSKKTCSFLFLWINIILIYIVLVPISVFIWKPGTPSIDGSNVYLNIYAMSDLLTNYTSLFAFLFIGVAIFGGILNRKNKKVIVEKSKLFLPFAWLSIIFLFIGATYFFIQPFIDIFIIDDWESKKSNISILIILVITLLLSWLHSLLEKHWDKKHKNDYLPKNYIYINDSNDDLISLKTEKNHINKLTKEESWLNSNDDDRLKELRD